MSVVIVVLSCYVLFLRVHGLQYVAEEIRVKSRTEKATDMRHLILATDAT